MKRFKPYIIQEWVIDTSQKELRIIVGKDSVLTVNIKIGFEFAKMNCIF